MAELLRDNIEAERRGGQGNRDSSGCSSGNGNRKPPRREVPDILSWCQCFGIYVRVVATKQPERVSQMLAYQATLVRDARRCEGGGRTTRRSASRRLATKRWIGPRLTAPSMRPPSWHRARERARAVTTVQRPITRARLVQPHRCRSGTMQEGWALSSQLGPSTNRAARGWAVRGVAQGSHTPAGRTHYEERRQCASRSMTGGAASRGGGQVQTHLS